MTEPDYKQILKNQDLISNLSIEEVERFERLLFRRKRELEEKHPDWHILDNPDNIKVSKQEVIEDLVPRMEYTISVNQEAVTDHKNLWRKWYIDNMHRTKETVDEFMDSEILRWMEQKLEKVMKDT
jgi:restriction endonuclease S subunit